MHLYCFSHKPGGSFVCKKVGKTTVKKRYTIDIYIMYSNHNKNRKNNATDSSP